MLLRHRLLLQLGLLVSVGGGALLAAHLTRVAPISNPFRDRCRLPGSDGGPWVYALPWDGQWVVYLPLQQLAFVANRAMADYALRAAELPGDETSASFAEARAFLDGVGFFGPAELRPETLEVPAEAPFAPTIAVLLPTTACNLRCVYCYASAGEGRGGLLPLEAGKAAIDLVARNARQSGADRFSVCFHGGGEPSLALGLLDALVAHARRQDVPAQVSLATNGVWDDETRDWVLSHVDDVSLSCDGLPEVHDRQRPAADGGDTWDRVLGAVAALEERGIRYGIRATVTEQAVDDLPRGIELLCRRTGCTQIQAEPAFDHGRARRTRESVASGERFAEAFLEAHDVAAGFGRHLFYSGARPMVHTAEFCAAPRNALIVNNEGRLTACYEVFHSSLPLAPRFFVGDVVPTTGEVQIGAGRRAALLGAIAERRSLCRECFCYWHCAGDCPAKTLTADSAGDLAFGPRCEVNRRITLGLLLRRIEAASGVWRGGEGLQAAGSEAFP